MYPVSDSYKQAIRSSSREFQWGGTLTTTNGRTYDFTNADIVKGSCSITNQCCGNSEIEIGSVYAAELDINLYKNIDRHTLEGGQITLSFFLRLPNNTYEEVPMGIFDISEANRGISYISIKAYDHMLRFDKDFDSDATNGTAYELLSLACEECGVTLAHTEEEIEAWPNGTEILGIYPENDIESWRDLLYYIAQALGRFCTINREGELELRTYGNTSVLEITDRHRFDSDFSDFVTRYTAVSSTNRRTQEAEYYALEPDDALTMNLGINPLLQYGLTETRTRLLTNILNLIALIQYVPFDSSTIGDPALDLGDVITCSGQHAGEATLTCVTKYTCRVNGKYDIACVGKDPQLAAAKSKNDKNITGLINEIVADKIAVYKFVNAAAYTIGTEETRIAYLEFASNGDTDAQFHASILLNVTATPVTKTGTVTIEEQTYNVSTPDDGKAVLTVVYIFNDVRLITFMPVETLCSGKHILNLYYPLTSISSSTLNTFQILLSMTGGTATLAVGQAICTISGQGLNASNEWNGHIDASEEFYCISLQHTDLAPELSGTVTAATQQPTPATVSQQYSPFTMGFNLSIGGLTAVVTPFPVMVKNTIDTGDASAMTYNHYYINIADGFRLETTYRFTSTERQISRGRMVQVDVNSGQFTRVDSMEVR